MVKIHVIESEADTQVTGDFSVIIAELVIGVASVYHIFATVHSKEVANAFKNAFIEQLMTVDEVWEAPDEIVVIDRDKMSDTPTDQS